MRCAKPPSALCLACAQNLINPCELARTSWGLAPGVRLASMGRLMSKVIRRIKDSGETALLEPLLAKSAKNTLAELVARLSAEVLIFVPMPSSRRSWRKRGYNIAREISLALARSCPEPALVSRALEFVYEPQDQRGLGQLARASNLNESMTVNFELLAKELARLPPEKRVGIVLCDDVVTTGATVTEALRAIRDALPQRSGSSSALASFAGSIPVGVFALAETLLKSDTRIQRRV